MTKYLLSLLLLILTSACASQPKKPILLHFTNSDCDLNFHQALKDNVLGQLKAISFFYERECHQEVISLGGYVRERSRDKIYHVIAETAEFVLPDGSLTEYTLESYERAYLSFLMAASYQKLQLQDASQVELRQAYQEGKALIYNHGDDPVNLALQAALWENSNQDLNSRPLWKKISELANDDLVLQNFAEKRIAEIDKGKKQKAKWNIYTFKEFPKINWNMNLSKSSGGYFELSPVTSFPMTCTSKKGLLISTEPWLKKISIRHHQEYHPLLDVRSWTRLPVGLTLGATTAVAGIGVGVGGCVLVAGLLSGGKSGSSGGGEATAQLCSASLQAGAAIAGEAGSVTRYVLEPDLRRWEQIPAAFLITPEEDPTQDSCSSQDFEVQGVPFHRL
jgi:hypothetical protein